MSSRFALASRRESAHRGPVAAGEVTVTLGILFAAAVLFAYPLSLSEAFDPPDWVRVVGLIWLPIGFAGVPISYVLSEPGAGRRTARLGVGIGLVGLLAFAALVVIAG